MNMLGRVGGLIALLIVLLAVPATPAGAVVNKVTCQTSSVGIRTGRYEVNMCLKIEYLPGGVRALLAFDCYRVYANPPSKEDVACNYDVHDLTLNDTRANRSVLGYGHVTGKSYHQFASPWYACNEAGTASYSAYFVSANVRFPNGELLGIAAFGTEPPNVRIGCS